MTLVPASSVISSGDHEVGGEVRKTPTASTANTLKCKKDPLNRLFLRVRTRSLSPAAVDKAVSAVIVMKNTDRMKVLQMAAIPVARSLRAVFCGVFWQEGCFCSYVDCRLQYQSSLEAATMAFEADEQLPDDQEGLSTLQTLENLVISTAHTATEEARA